MNEKDYRPARSGKIATNQYISIDFKAFILSDCECEPSPSTGWAEVYQCMRCF